MNIEALGNRKGIRMGSIYVRVNHFYLFGLLTTMMTSGSWSVSTKKGFGRWKQMQLVQLVQCDVTWPMVGGWLMLHHEPIVCECPTTRVLAHSPMKDTQVKKKKKEWEPDRRTQEDERRRTRENEAFDECREDNEASPWLDRKQAKEETPRLISIPCIRARQQGLLLLLLSVQVTNRDGWGFLICWRAILLLLLLLLLLLRSSFQEGSNSPAQSLLSCAVSKLHRYGYHITTRGGSRLDDAAINKTFHTLRASLLLPCFPSSSVSRIE